MEATSELELLNDVWQYRLIGGFNRVTLSGEQTAEITAYYTLVPGYVSWHLSPDVVVGGVTELQGARRHYQTYSGEVVRRDDFASWHQILSLDWRRRWSFSLVYDYTSDNSFQDAQGRPRHRWLSAEVGWHDGSRSRITFSYGGEKGGVRCTGGVCRVLNPFDGWRLSMEWRW